jgi:hypothetical protein
LPTSSKSSSTTSVAAPPRSVEDLDELRTGLAHHGRRTGLDDAGLLGGDVFERRPGELGVVHPDVGDHRHGRVDDVGGVPPTEQPDLDHHHVDGDVGEPPERSRGHDLEVSGAHPDDRFEFGDRRHLLGELLVGDRFEVAADALVDPLEVRARVGAHGETARDEQPRDHLGGRSLAVGAGDVDHRRRVLRIAHRRTQRSDVVERRRLDPAGLLVGGVLVEISQRVGVVHGGAQATDEMRRGV